MNYQQSLVLEAPPAAVYAALARGDGLRGWWTVDCEAAANVGGTIDLRFGRSRKVMRIERLEPARGVRWLCTGAHIAAGDLSRRDEWVGTRLVFRLIPEAAGRTLLEFEHVGLMPELECFELCRNGWRCFLASLQQFVETGRGTPYARAAAAA